MIVVQNYSNSRFFQDSIFFGNAVKLFSKHLKTRKNIFVIVATYRTLSNQKLVSLIFKVTYNLHIGVVLEKCQNSFRMVVKARNFFFCVVIFMWLYRLKKNLKFSFLRGNRCTLISTRFWKSYCLPCLIYN